MRRLSLILILLAAISAFLFFGSKSETVKIAETSSSTKVERSLPIASKNPMPAPLPHNRSTVVDLAPKIESLREEIKRNPHETPPSLIQFALELSAKLSQAEATTSDADELMNELEDCVTNSQIHSSTSARALCFANAKRLAANIPSLAARFQNLVAKTDSDILRLIP